MAYHAGMWRYSYRVGLSFGSTLPRGVRATREVGKRVDRNTEGEIRSNKAKGRLFINRTPVLPSSCPWKDHPGFLRVRGHSGEIEFRANTSELARPRHDPG